jgi:DNA-binding response OmpR family regulator
MHSNPAMLLVVGEGRANDMLAEELTLDGYDARPAHPRALRAPCASSDVELVILNTAGQAGNLELLHTVRAGEFAPQLKPGVYVLSIAATGETTEVLHTFDAGADDVVRRPIAYAELVGLISSNELASASLDFK